MQYVEKIRATVESLLFITNEPLTPAQIAELAEVEETDVLDVLREWTCCKDKVMERIPYF